MIHRIIITQSNNKDDTMPDEWILLSEVVSLIAYNITLKIQIQNKLMELYQSGLHPDWIKRIGVNRYRFNKKYLENFCKVYGFDLATPLNRNNPDYKTHDWLSAKDLRAYLPGSEKQISDILKELQPQMPNAIQIKHNGPIVRLCLHKDYIQTVKNFVSQRDTGKTQVLMQNIVFVEKDGPDEWINASALRQFISNSIENREYLHNILIRIAKTGLYSFVIRQTSKARYMFNKKYLKEFCNQCQFGMKDTPDKNITWLKVVDLQRIISKPNEDFSKTLTTALKDLYTKGKHPDWVCHPSEHRYYLNKEYVAHFAKMYKFNLICRDTRTDEWLTPTEIVSQIQFGSPNMVLNLLQKYQSQMPEWIKTKRKYQLACLCLHRDRIEEFCKLANIKMLEGEHIKTSDWFSVLEYRLFLKNFDAATQMDALQAAFEIVAKTHPDWIQPKLCKSGETKLCLNKNHIKDFCAETDFVCDNKKTEDWLDVRELGLMLNMSPAKILVVLQVNQKSHSDIVQIRYLNSTPVLCLKRGHIDKIAQWQQELDIDGMANILNIIQNKKSKLK